MTSANGRPLPVSYPDPFASGGAPPLSTTCTPSSGATFDIGTTAVTCTTTDSRQRTDTCTFNVTVVEPPKLTVTRFGAFGDSITWGENGVSMAAFGLTDRVRPRTQVPLNYPTVLYQTLALRYTTQSIVVGNLGQPAELAADPDTRARFSGVARSRLWDVLLLMEGSNDLNVNGLSGRQAALDSVRSMIRDGKSRGVKMYLATIPPMDGSLCCPRRGSAAPLVPGYNDQLKAIAQSEGVPLVDVFAAFPSPVSAYLSGDGLHPN
jgi:lysophospholipase L1-like esterase